MKSEMNLQELAQMVQMHQTQKRDYVATLPAIEAMVDMERSQELVLKLAGNEFDISDLAHRQIGERLGIPGKYYDRMRRDYPELLAENVRAWLGREDRRRFLVRTLNGNIRAVLSDSYRPLDNDLVLEAALPVLADSGLSFQASALTDSRLYLQARSPRLEGEVKPGDVVQAGLMISNSETGQGALRVEQMVWRLVCTNGSIHGQSLRKAHVGKQLGADLEAGVGFYRSDTQAADNRAFQLKVRDTVRNALSEDGFRAVIEDMKAAAARETTRPVSEVIEVTQKKFDLSQGESEGILQHLATGGDLSQWGLANAVTRTAQDVTGDRAVELERVGGSIIELGSSDWSELYKKAA